MIPPVSPKAMALLQTTRAKVAHGSPSLAYSIARAEHAHSSERLRAAAALRDAEALGERVQALHDIRVLAEAIRWVEKARDVWGFDEGRVPALARDEPPCVGEVRFFLEAAGQCSALALPFEDPDGLDRAQAVCVLTLALLLIQAEAWSA